MWTGSCRFFTLDVEHSMPIGISQQLLSKIDEISISEFKMQILLNVQFSLNFLESNKKHTEARFSTQTYSVMQRASQVQREDWLPMTCYLILLIYPYYNVVRCVFWDQKISIRNEISLWIRNKQWYHILISCRVSFCFSGGREVKANKWIINSDRSTCAQTVSTTVYSQVITH